MNRITCLVLLLAFVQILPARAEDRSTGNINLFLGTKHLWADDWRPAERQGEAAVEFDNRGPDWPVAMVFGLRGARGTGVANIAAMGGRTEVTSRTSEIQFGIKKVWDPTPEFHPFLGFGLAFVGAEAVYESATMRISDSDDGGGSWLSGGMMLTLGGAFNLGLELSVSSARAKLFGSTVRSGGSHFGLLLGYHWGSRP